MATELWLRYDIRNGGVAAPRTALYAAAVEQVAWADRLGFDAVMIGEHHGADDGYIPSVASPELLEGYRSECQRLDRIPGRIVCFSGTGFIHVSRDPERAWTMIGNCLLHEMNACGKWAREGGANTGFLPDIADVEMLKKTGAYFVLTPDECLAHMRHEREASRSIMFNPLCGGMHPDLAWESLELFAAEVLPRYLPKSAIPV